MANTNIGGISWVVDADTSPAVDSISDLSKQTKMATKSLVGLDSSTKKTTKKIRELDVATMDFVASLKKSGNTITKNGVVMGRFGTVNAKATEQLKALNREQEKAVATQKRLASSSGILSTSMKKTSEGVKKGMAGMSRGAGQAGIQVQQFIGQIQGGQAVMLAFSQQAADIGIVLGAPMVGAILGITASLVGMLIPSLMNSKKGMELLEKATMNVQAALTLGSDGIISYTDDMKKLKSVSESLAKIKVATLIAEQNMAMAESGKMFKAALKDATSWSSEVGAAMDIFGKKGGPSIGAAELDALQRMQKAADEFDVTKPAESVALMEKALKNATAAGINNTKIGQELSTQMVGLIAGYKIGEKTVADLDKRLKDLNFTEDESIKKTKGYKDEINSMVDALVEQAQQLGETNRQTAIRAATIKGATEAQKEAINTAFDDIEAKEGQIEAQKELDRIMEQSFKNDLKRANQDKSDKNKAIGFAEGVTASGLSPIEKLEEENTQLLALKAKYVDDSAVFDEALTANAKKQDDLRSAYSIANANMILSASSDLFGGLASLLKSSGDDQSNAYKAMFALSQGFAVAQAALNLSLAISNASAISPWYASLPAVASVVSAGAGLASSIAGASYSGREHGGSVVGGQTYEVGEKNKPEMLMIPGNGGKVFSNAEMKSAMGGGGGNGGGVEVNLFGAPAGTEVQSREDPMTSKQVIDIVIGQMTNSNSKGRRGMQSNSNVRGVLNGGRRS